MTSQPARHYLTQHRTAVASKQGRDDEVTEQNAWDALRTLHRLNLIDHDPDTPHRAVRVHQLIQRATRDTLASTQYEETARSAADALVTAHATSLGQSLRANAQALIGHAEDSLWQPDGHEVLICSGRSLGEAGQAAEAVAYFQALAQIACQRLGPDHPDTLIARSGVARWRGAEGDAAGAATAYAELLADRERLLGPDHADTLITRAILTRWRGEAGDAAGAATAFEQLLADHLRILGPDNPDTLTARHNLAHWQSEAGDAVVHQSTD